MLCSLPRCNCLLLLLLEQEFNDFSWNICLQSCAKNGSTNEKGNIEKNCSQTSSSPLFSACFCAAPAVGELLERIFNQSAKIVALVYTFCKFLLFYCHHHSYFFYCKKYIMHFAFHSKHFLLYIHLFGKNISTEREILDLFKRSMVVS